MVHTLLKVLFILSSFIKINSVNVVGWYNGGSDGIVDIPLDMYTHIVTGSPIVFPNGTVQCNKTDIITTNITRLAHSHNPPRDVQWRCNIPNLTKVLFNDNYSYILDNYCSSIGDAMKECSIDGMEVDYEWGDSEWNIGIIPPFASNKYTDFLIRLKSSMPTGSIVSADVGVWGLNGGYPLGFLPWVNVTKFNNPSNSSNEIDFVNIMSYHHDKNNSIKLWEMDIKIFRDLWKFNMSKVNLGIPYFVNNYSHWPKIYNEPTWDSLSSSCPNAPYNLTICENVEFVSKEMNYKIGQLAKLEGVGLFPWTLNYDSFSYNNTMVTWLIKGYTS